MSSINSPPMRYQSRISRDHDASQKTLCSPSTGDVKAKHVFTGCMSVGGGEKWVLAYRVPAARFRLFVEGAGGADAEFPPGWRKLFLPSFISLLLSTYALSNFSVPSAKLQMLKPVLHFTDEETAYLRG